MSTSRSRDMLAVQFSDWVILPEQTARAITAPEMRLVAAVFESAIQSLTRYCDPKVAYERTRARGAQPSRWRSMSPREDALAWFASDDRRWPFSFLNCCDLLGFNAELVRATLLERNAS